MTLDGPAGPERLSTIGESVEIVKHGRIVAVALNAGLALLTSDRMILSWSGPLQRMDTRL